MGLQYRVYEKNYMEKRDELLGVLTERRAAVRCGSTIMAGLRWARVTYGKVVRDPHSVFVIPVDDEKGASSVEYAILVVGIAAAVIFGIEAFGKWIVPLFERGASIFK